MGRRRFLGNRLQSLVPAESGAALWFPRAPVVIASLLCPDVLHACPPRVRPLVRQARLHAAAGGGRGPAARPARQHAHGAGGERCWCMRAFAWGHVLTGCSCKNRQAAGEWEMEQHVAHQCPKAHRPLYGAAPIRRCKALRRGTSRLGTRKAWPPLPSSSACCCRLAPSSGGVVSCMQWGRQDSAGATAPVVVVAAAGGLAHLPGLPPAAQKPYQYAPPYTSPAAPLLLERRLQLVRALGGGGQPWGGNQQCKQGVGAGSTDGLGATHHANSCRAGGGCKACVRCHGEQRRNSMLLEKLNTRAHCSGKPLQTDAAFLTEESCTQYNVLKLARWLFRHTGDAGARAGFGCAAMQPIAA